MNFSNKLTKIAILGRTNVGKSTFLNSLTNKKVSATTSKVNTTRKPVHAIWTFQSQRFLLLDAPGTCQIKTSLDRILFHNIVNVVEISDYVWWLVDVFDYWGKDNQILAKLLQNYQKPVFLLINKIDLIDKNELLTKITFFQQKFAFRAIVPISARKKTNFLNLQKMVTEHLSTTKNENNEPTISRSIVFVQTVQEIVREQIIFHTKNELPHQTALLVDNWKQQNTNIFFEMTVFVATLSQKTIVLGKNGHKIREIRLSSQKILDKLWKKKTSLFLKVKVHKKWYQDSSFLQKLDVSWKD